jgi:hypothetical protein
MAKKSQQDELYNSLVKLTKKFLPDDILYELSLVYENISVNSESEAEVEFWLKCSKTTANLSGGMEKWFGEMNEEKNEEE